MAASPSMMDFVTERTHTEASVPAHGVTRLSVNDLTIVRGDRCLIESLGFDLRAGTALQITGPNGCGKTSLLRALAGLARPETGDIIWSGAAGRLAEPPLIAYLGHRNALKPDLTPREELGFAARLNAATPVSDAEHCLQQLGIGHCVDLPCGQLSAGQQRRVALARMLLSDRPVWILDEPLTALDAQACRGFGNLLAQHLQRGGLALLSTHQSLTLDTDRLQTLSLEASC